MNRKKCVWSVMLVAMLMAIGLFLLGCGDGADQQGEQVEGEKVVKVGVVGPFTGPASRVGDEFKGAIEMAFDEIDHKIGDYQVEFVWIDCESDAEKAARAYEQAIVRDEIDVAFNTWHSWVSVALMDISAKYQMPHFLSFGATEIVNETFQSDPEKYKYWAGKTWPTPSLLSIAYVDAITEAIEKGLWDPPTKKVAIYGVDNDWGRSFGNAIASQFEDAGWEVAATEWVALGETEFYPLLSKLQQLNVSVVAGSMSDPPSISAFIKQSQEIGLESLIIADGLGWVGEWYDLTGEASNFVLDQIPQWVTPEAIKFRDDFTARFGFEPGASSGGLMYDSSRFLIKIMEETLKDYGALTRENFARINEERLMIGDLTFTEGIFMKEYKYTSETFPDPVVGQDHYIFPVIQYFDGEGVVIWPDAWKEADLAIPDHLR